MNPNATHEALTQPRWSTEDDLLVWTVSRIHGGRRHGIEPDCHVVYAVTPAHFVEQTRKYRASAHQCMELLLSGQRAGTTQRKIELDTIVAVHSDARSGRLVIKTLNGVHRLDALNEDEADALREIATQLELRMPAGGAAYPELDTTRYQGDERRVPVDRDEWLSMRSVQNARLEDEPDTTSAPQYEVHLDPGSPSTPESPYAVESPSAVESPYAPESNAPRFGPDPSRVTPSGIHAAAVEPRSEWPLGSSPDATNHHRPPMPEGITVAGDVPIVYQPVQETTDPEPVAAVAWVAPGEEPALDPEPETLAATSVPTAIDPHAEGPAATVSPTATDPESDESPVATLPPAEDAEPGPTPGVHPEPAAATSETVEDDPSADDADDTTAEPAFDRRQRRALFQFRRKPVDDGVPTDPGSPAPVASDPPEAETQPPVVPPALMGHRTTPDAWAPGQADRRHHDDPRFPALFDRRKPAETPTRAIFDRRGQGPTMRPTDDVPTWVESEAAPGGAEGDGQASETPAPKRKDPPTLGPVTLPAQSGGQGLGGGIGFNPDFDVNPYR